jgi:hypothetical protein
MYIAKFKSKRNFISGFIQQQSMNGDFRSIWNILPEFLSSFIITNKISIGYIIFCPVTEKAELYNHKNKIF